MPGVTMGHTTTMVAVNMPVVMRIMAVTPMDTRMVIITTDEDQPKKKNAQEIMIMVRAVRSPKMTIRTTKRSVKFNVPGRRFRAAC